MNPKLKLANVLTKAGWGAHGKAHILVGGQFGSEGKGLIAAAIGESMTRNEVHGVIATTNAGAQAGHTTRYRDSSREDFVCFHLPTIGVVHKGADIYVNAGSIIDVDVFEQELLRTGVDQKRVHVNPFASVITDEARRAERDVASSTTRVASTQKGVGATIAAKVMRRAQVVIKTPPLQPYCAQLDLNRMMQNGSTVTVEVPQGTGLSINHSGFYPYTTSRDCWVGSGLNDAGISPRYLGAVCMVVRTFPIRVGAIYNELGEKLGDSGNFYADSNELDWEKDFPGIEPERTTVTKRVRRIATWSRGQYRDALSLNRPGIVALTFCNYLQSAEEFFWHVEAMRADEVAVLGQPIVHLYSGTPYTEEVFTDASDIIEHMTKTGVWQ